MERHITLTIDEAAETAYLKLSNAPIARTRQFDDAVLVDLDEFDMVVGIEFLDIHAPFPLDELAKQHHIEAPVLAYLRKIQDSVGYGKTTATATIGSASPAPEYGTVALR